MDYHTFWRSFRWYQRRCCPLTGTLEPPAPLDQDHEHHEDMMFAESIQDNLYSIDVSYNVTRMHS